MQDKVGPIDLYLVLVLKNVWYILFFVSHDPASVRTFIIIQYRYMHIF